MRYYYEDESDYLCVATVRPETIFGDVAIAVNPNDERYKNLIGKKVRVPICNRLIEVIADDYADPLFGTGCVKITPAHDPNDFLVGERHNLEKINTINPDGTMNEFTGEFNGLERFDARKAVLKKLKELDLIEKIEDYKHNVGFSQRGGEPIEPYLSDQWFVSMKPLAEIALNVVLEGKVKFHPNHWVKTFEHWMTNIRDWCISRQLWWGHRIPVYYAPDGQFTAAANAEEARLKLGLNPDIELVQDNDVLDTWFSSWLWQMTTMRWNPNAENDDSDDMLKFLPTDLLVTAPDIIFFWVARMIMASVYFKNVIPFKDVYFTSLIRDGQGRKLSKSLGNSPDPLNIIDKYGADAVRFTMLFLSPLGQDVKMDVNVETQDIPSVEIGRNFCNKIWNAGRFLLMKDEQAKENINNPTENLLSENELTIGDKWILSRFNSTINKIDDALENYKVNDYSKIIYDFVWRDFCDWYVEIVKIQYNQSEEQDYRIRLMNSVIHLYENILKLLHPIVPFITEEIWHLLGDKDDNTNIINQESPKADSNKIVESIEFNFELLQNIIEEIRRLRSTTSVAPSQKLPVIISTSNKELFDYFSEVKQIIKVLGKCSELDITSAIDKPEGSLASIIKDVEIFVIVGGSINIEQEKARLDKEIQRLENLINSTNKKLSNEKFVNNASAEIVAKEREKLESMENSLKVVIENFNSL
jgi:valyl-tRNA synthetase